MAAVIVCEKVLCLPKISPLLRSRSSIFPPQAQEGRLNIPEAQMPDRYHQRKTDQRPSAGHIEVRQSHDVAIDKGGGFENDEKVQQINRIAIRARLPDDA